MSNEHKQASIAVILIPPLTYEQQLELKQKQAEEHVQIIQKKLNQNFPTFYVALYAIILFILGLCGIGLQIVLILTEATNFYCYQGIWAGGVCITLSTVSLLLIKTRSYNCYLISVVIHLIGILIIAAGFILANVYEVSAYSKCFHVARCNWREVYPYIWCNITMLFIGAFSVVLCVFYFIAMSIRMKGCIGRSNYGRIYYGPTYQK